MEVNVIASGSSGNSVLLGESVLIDVGVTYKAIEPYVRNIKLVLCTHQHGDHFKKSCVRRLAKERPNLRFACGSWMVPLLIMEKVSPRRIDVIPENKWMNYGSIGVKVKQQSTLHDVLNCCWHIDINGEKAFYATDMGTLEGIEAKDYNLYMIEANREEDELEETIKRKRESGEFVYESRVKGTHFMVEQANKFLSDNMSEDSEYVFLHKHNPSE